MVTMKIELRYVPTAPAGRIRASARGKGGVNGKLAGGGGKRWRRLLWGRSLSAGTEVRRRRSDIWAADRTRASAGGYTCVDGRISCGQDLGIVKTLLGICRFLKGYYACVRWDGGGPGRGWCLHTKAGRVMAASVMDVTRTGRRQVL